MKFYLHTNTRCTTIRTCKSHTSMHESTGMGGWGWKKFHGDGREWGWFSLPCHSLEAIRLLSGVKFFLYVTYNYQWLDTHAVNTSSMWALAGGRIMSLDALRWNWSELVCVGVKQMYFSHAESSMDNNTHALRVCWVSCYGRGRWWVGKVVWLRVVECEIPYPASFL